MLTQIIYRYNPNTLRRPLDHYAQPWPQSCECLLEWIDSNEQQLFKFYKTNTIDLMLQILIKDV